MKFNAIEQPGNSVNNNNPEKENDLEWLEKIRKYYVGEMHSHSQKSNRSEMGGSEDGSLHNYNSLMRYADKLGLDFVVFSEHASSPGNPELLEEKSLICSSLEEQQNDIDEINNSNKYSPIAFSAVEASIFFNEDNRAVLDVPDSVLAKLDLVIASRHSISEKLEPDKIKESLLTAIRNPEVDIIGHPYRGIEFYNNDWNYFKKYFLKDPAINEELKKMDDEKDWDKIKQIIGKTELSGDARVGELHEMFSNLKGKYWEMWDEVLDEMETHGKIFEINLNVISPGKEFYRSLLEKAAQRKDLMFSISYDFHNLSQRDGFEKDDKKRLKDGRDKAIRRLLDLTDLLEELDIDPKRVVNSSLDNLREFIADREKERNIQVLRDKGYETYCSVEQLSKKLNQDIVSLEVKEVGVVAGKISKFQLKCTASDGREYYFKENADYNSERVFNLMKLLNSGDKNLTNKPLYLSENKDVLAYENIDGDVGRDKLITGTEDERKVLAEKTANLIKNIHGLDINKFASVINIDNYNLENIRKSTKIDLIDAISAKDESIGQKLNSVYEELAKKETEILEKSEKVLIHGDFHPGNILLNNENETQLIDFKNMTIGVKERDIASMLEQVYAQCGNREGEKMEENEILKWQEDFLKNYKDDIDSQKIIFYRAWISFRNSVYCFSKYYMDKNKDVDIKNARLFLDNAVKHLEEYKNNLSA